MVGALADSAAVLRRAFRPLLVFEATIGLATIIVLDPLLLLLLDRIVALGGDPFVGNSALIAFALSLPGLMAVAVATVAATFVAVATFGGVSLILWGAQRVQPPRHLPVWASLLARVPALLAISAWAVGAAVLLALPILGTALIAWRWLLSGGDFYFYFTTRPPEFIWAAGAVAVAAAMAAIGGLLLLLRTGLAVPICLTQPVGARQALRLAARATRGRQLALMLKLLGVAAGLAVFWAVALAALSILPEWLISRPMSGTALIYTGALLAAAGAFGFAVLAAISRGAMLLVLLQDRAAENALPSSAEPGPTRARYRGFGVVATLAICATIPIAAAIQIAGSASGPHVIGITAHRAGSARAPENTLAALRNAIAEGADVVEIDAQEAADGKVVLLHDTDLRRVAGVARFVWEMRSDELQLLDVGSWFAPQFAGERIPTLRELAEASRGRVRLNVEIKNNGHGEDLAARVVAVLRQTGVADQAAISSLDLGLLRQVRRVAPEIKLGLILATGIGNLRAVDVDFIAIARRLATPAVIRQLAANGREVHVWTLDDDATMARGMLNGAANIITGDTLRAVRVRDWFNGLSEPERILLRVPNLIRTGWLGVARLPTPAHGMLSDQSTGARNPDPTPSEE
jgi:glycerophosphoryl diester phosphodiesterase